MLRAAIIGNTAANETWKIQWIDANTFSLYDPQGKASVGNGDHKSGGVWEKLSANAQSKSYALQEELERAQASGSGHGPYPNVYQAAVKDVYNSIGPGWVHIGCLKDCPKNARFVGRHGNTCVWVTPDGMESLTNLTIAILDVSTADMSKMSAQGGAASPGGSSISSPRIRSYIAPQQIAPTP